MRVKSGGEFDGEERGDFVLAAVHCQKCPGILSNVKLKAKTIIKKIQNYFFLLHPKSSVIRCKTFAVIFVQCMENEECAKVS